MFDRRWIRYNRSVIMTKSFTISLRLRVIILCYVVKTWSVFESHSRNTFCKRNVCEEGGVSIERKQSRAVSDPYQVAEKVGL